MFLDRKDVENGKKYFVTQDSWVDLGNAKEYIGTKFLSLESKKILEMSQVSSDKILSEFFSVSVECEVVDGNVYTKILDESIKLHLFQVLKLSDLDDDSRQNFLGDGCNSQDHKDAILGNITSLEAIFPIGENDEAQNAITNLLDTLYNDISAILDRYTEQDNKDDTIEKVSARLRIFLKEIDQDTHANITIDTDGSLFDILKEARNFLDKKFLSREENDTDNEWLEGVIEDHMNPPVPSTIKDYDSAVFYLREAIEYFYEIEGNFGDEEGLAHRVDEFHDDIQSLIDSLQEAIVTPDQHFDFKQKTDTVYKNFLINVYSEEKLLDKSVYHHSDFTEIEKRIGLVIMFKFSKDYFVSTDDSVKSLWSQLVECADDNTKESILQSLGKLTSEQFNDLGIEELQQLLEILLDKEDYKFAVRIRDAIGSK